MREGGVINLSAESATPPLHPPGPPAPTSGALMHALRTARVSAPRPEQTGHSFTRRSKSVGRSALVAATSLGLPASPPPHLHPLFQSAFPYFSRRALACATSGRRPSSRSNRGGRDEPQRGERLRGEGRDEGRGGRPPRVNLAPPGRERRRAERRGALMAAPPVRARRGKS